LRDLVGRDVIALLFVPVIILAAAFGGADSWWAAPILAFISLDFFFTPPYLTLRVATPREWLTLGVFLVVALVSSRQVLRLRLRTAEALARQRDLALLNRLSAQLNSHAVIADIAHVLARSLQDLGFRRVVLFVTAPAKDGLVAIGDFAGERDTAAAEWVYHQNKAIGLPPSVVRGQGSDVWPVSVDASEALGAPQRGIYLPLHASSGDLEGVLLAEPPLAEGAADPVERAQMLVSASNLVAAFLEREGLERQTLALATLEEADRLKSSFVSAVSHDLKTPLAAAKATVTGLLEGDIHVDDPRLRSDLEATEASLDRLDAAIGDLLDLSRLESDAWRPVFEDTAIGEILSTMLARLTPADRSRVSVRVQEDLPEVAVDFRQVERMVRNLVENALRYSHGPVRVAAEQRGAEIVLSVEDEGPGVPPGERGRIFDRFFRGAGSDVAPGSGLGLAIAREIARAHGGRLWVEDASPRGSRFVVALPK
jgi:two-component system, OmpR family, sensor histidine kinase KdpD